MQQCAVAPDSRLILINAGPAVSGNILDAHEKELRPKALVGRVGAGSPKVWLFDV